MTTLLRTTAAAVTLAAVALAQPAGKGPHTVLLPSKSQLVSFRISFLTGAADDPADFPGLAALTAAMLGAGGTRTQSYQEIVDTLYPMAVNVDYTVDKELTTFSAVTHTDNLNSFWTVLRSMLLDPGWREEDLRRLRDEAVNTLRENIRANNDEELGKEVLYGRIYSGHPYGHHNLGTAAALGKIGAAELKRFYRDHYSQSNLIIGLAGGYPAGFVERVKKDLAALSMGTRSAKKRPAPRPLDGVRMTMVEKNTRAVAISFGFPIHVRRGDPDFLPLLVMQSALGQHRDSGGRLYQRIRESRGLNYGDYAYIEYFPEGMFRFEPRPNLARMQQIFQIWIRPLEPPTAHFGLRLALHELERLIRDGLSQEEFERTRTYLSKYANLLTKTKSAELGYAIDSLFYGIPPYAQYVQTGLAKLSLSDVNRAIRKHLSMERMHIVWIAKDCENWKKTLLSNASSPMKYNSSKPAPLLEEDKLVEARPLPLKPETIEIVPVAKIFE